MKRQINRLSCCLLALALVLGLTGCGSTKLDQNPGQASLPVSGSEELDTQSTDFDISTTVDSSTDFSKYEDTSSDAAVSSSAPSKENQSGSTTSPAAPAGQDAAEPADAPDTAPETKDDTLTCYVTISCAQILNNMDQLTDGKESLVPSSGVLLSRKAVTFQPGETAFDVLKRVTKDNRIHMESRFTPAYNSAYICGIGNLYEFDCGPESGWMYCVNGWYPNYGVSNYELKDQDDLRFNYTCDLGRDLGGSWQG